MFEHEVTVCFATMSRPECAVRLTKSIRDVYPSVRILVGLQTKGSDSYQAALERAGAEVVILPFDYGVCASRNRLVEKVETPFFVICDDDFIWTRDTKFDVALRALRETENLAVVGGLLYDLWSPEPSQKDPRHWERHLYLDASKRLLTMVALEEAPLTPLGGHSDVWLVDAVMNFAVMKTEAHRSGARWDEQFKSNGEHEDFFLNLKLNTGYLVGYCPRMFAYHYSVVPPGYGAYRDRSDGWRRLSAKWGIDRIRDGRQILELTTGAFAPIPEPVSALRRLRGWERDPALGRDRVGITPDGKFYCAPSGSSLEVTSRQIEDRIKRARKEVTKTFRSSTSWKVTKPLRFVGRTLKGIARGFSRQRSK
ncbi:MAG: glycosyltransferase [Devosia sp.]|uniref:glycosyltransferase family 2 protein n=1 Tax=Devosia sp. TaxID=1871048 RepID=UPI001A40BB02|nr:glycosyltransferase [Devosia sp.]MBL8599245.1 glycosyltransferase [Devosia sp.]